MASQVYGLVSAFPLEQFQGAKRAWSARLLHASRPRIAYAAATAAPEDNVVGVGIGEKISNGKRTGVAALKFFVERKFDEAALPEDARLPKEIAGLPVDVDEVGRFHALQVAVTASTSVDPKTRLRPAQPGCSVGFREPNDAFVMAGTFGALVLDRKNQNKVSILSNSHVLANEGTLPAGSPIYQPGILDDRNFAHNQIATLTRFEPFVASPAFNKVDAAIAALGDPAAAVADVLQIGKPSGAAAAAVNATVQKFGRTTSFTAGTITSVNTDVKVQYESGVFVFENQIIIVGLDGQPFSAAGDSGSLIVDRSTFKALGLLFAGSSTHTIANQIGDVLSVLNVDLA